VEALILFNKIIYRNKRFWQRLSDFFLRRGPLAGYGKYVQHEWQKTRNVNERKLNKVLEQT